MLLYLFFRIKKKLSQNKNKVKRKKIGHTKSKKSKAFIHISIFSFSILFRCVCLCLCAFFSLCFFFTRTYLFFLLRHYTKLVVVLWYTVVFMYNSTICIFRCIITNKKNTNNKKKNLIQTRTRVYQVELKQPQVSKINFFRQSRAKNMGKFVQVKKKLSPQAKH